MNSSTFSSEPTPWWLPASLRERLADYSYLGQLSLVRTVWPFVLLAVLVGIVFWLRRSQVRGRFPLLLVAWVLIGRVVLWGNPAAWYGYSRTLDNETVGWRQANVVNDELRRYFTPNPNLKYLAIGSSQTGAIYGPYGKAHHELYKYELAGMGPVEYFLYRDAVTDLRPDIVLLYLSEFDLGRKPAYSAFRYAPIPGLDLVSYGRMLIAADGDEAQTAIRDLVIGNLFPEYRYAFVQKAYLGRWADAIAGGAEPGNRFAAQDLDTKLSEGPFKLSIDGLERFIEFCQRQSVKVVIVEGQYHPDGFGPSNQALNRIAVAAFERLASDHANTRFFGRGLLPDLIAGDFLDGYHLTDAAGLEYATAVIRLAEAQRWSDR